MQTQNGSQLRPQPAGSCIISTKWTKSKCPAYCSGGNKSTTIYVGKASSFSNQTCFRSGFRKALKHVLRFTLLLLFSENSSKHRFTCKHLLTLWLTVKTITEIFWEKGVIKKSQNVIRRDKPIRWTISYLSARNTVGQTMNNTRLLTDIRHKIQVTKTL